MRDVCLAGLHRRRQGESGAGGYIKEVKFQQPPYTTSPDLIRHLRQVTPDSLQYLITDMFERITLYENRVDSVSYKKLPGGKYQVTLNLNSKKFYADSLGNEKPAPMNDWVDIARAHGA